jgi:uncharacterized membrane-anchored protein
MNRLFPIIAMLSALLTLASAPLHAFASDKHEGDVAEGQIENAAPPSYDWRLGPEVVTVGDQATLKIPPGYAVLVEKQAQQMLRRLGNPDVRNVIGVAANADKDWLVVVRFEKTGYVRDADAKNLNPDALLDALKKNAEHTNQQRSKQKVEAMEILGWLEKPSYDPKLHRLTWAIAERDKNSFNPASQGVNYNTYVLGKYGYFSLNLVTSLQNIGKNKAHLTTLLSGLSFQDGKKYEDFKPDTDKASHIALSDLVTGDLPQRKPGVRGAIQGFFADYGWLLLGIVLAIAAGVGGFFGWRFWKRRHPPVSLLGEPVEPSMPDDGAAPPKKA